MSSTIMPQHPYAPQMPPAPKKNGFGTAAMVLGIIAAVFSFIPLFGAFVAIPLAIIAIILGGVGMILAFTGKAGKGLPIAGLVLGLVAMLISIWLSVSAVKAVDDAVNETSTTTTIDDSAVDNASKKSKSSSDDAAESTRAGIGDKVVDKDLQFTVTKVKTAVTQVGDSTFGEEAAGEFTIVSLTIKNVGARSADFSTFSQYAFDAKGARYDTDTDAGYDVNEDGAIFDDLNPGNQVKAKLVFDMPQGVEASTLELHDGTFTDGVTIDLG